MKQEILYLLMAMISKLYCQIEKVNICENGYVFMYVCSQSVQSFSRVRLFAIPWTAACQVPCLSPTPGACSNSCPPSWWCHPTISCSLVPFPPAFNRSQHQVFSNESVLRIRWPKDWSFSVSISPSNEYSGLISFRINWLDLLTVQGTLGSLKSLLQHHSLKASILWHSAFCPTLTSTHYY